MSVSRHLVSTIFLVVAGLATMSVYAEGDIERGEVLATACLGCHGIAGYRNAYPSYRVPKLAGQHAQYLAIGLTGYQSKGRQHPTMQAQAANLSDADIRDLAAYFSAQGELESGSAAGGERIERGAAKAAVCAACHGTNGVSEMPTWPTLAGQHEDYLQQALTQYQQGTRTDPVMAGQVIDLTAEDIEDLAAYFAAQPGLVSID